MSFINNPNLGGGGAGVSDGDKGDITVSSSGATWTVDNDAITYAKMQNVSAQYKILGRSTSGAGDVEELSTSANMISLLGSADYSAARTNLGLAIGTNVQAYDAGLGALASFNTNGFIAQTADNTFAGRTITGTANQITVSNGDGVSGNPTLSIPYNAELGSSATAQSSLKFYEDTDNGSNSMTIQPPAAITADFTLTFPDGAGTNGYVLSTNGSGILSWVAPSGVTGLTASGEVFTFAGTSAGPTSIRLSEDTDNGTNYVALKAPDSLSSNLTFTLPSSYGSGGTLIAGTTGTITTPSGSPLTAVSNIDPSTAAPYTFTLCQQSAAIQTFASLGVINSPRAYPLTGGATTNQYFFNAGVGGIGVVSGFATANDECYVFPIWVPPGTYDTLEFGIQTADAGGTADIDVGIYHANYWDGNSTDYNVGMRVVDVGTESNISTTGIKSRSFTATRLSGWYWIALRIDNITTALSLGVSTVTYPQEANRIFGSSSSSDLSLDQCYGYKITAITSIPTTNFDSYTSYTKITSPVGVALRLA